MNAFDTMMQAGMEDNPVARLIFYPSDEFIKRVNETKTDKPKRPSHNQAILKMLKEARGGWVGLHELSERTQEVCGSRCYPISTRISNLRRAGHPIPPAKQMVVDGVTHVWYKLEIREVE